MDFIFPSEEDLDNICQHNSVPEGPFKTDSPLTLRLPNFVPLLLAVEQNSVLALKNARLQLVSVDNGALKSLKHFIRNFCGLSEGGGFASLFMSSATTLTNEMTLKAYENFLEINKRIFGKYLDDFKKILRDDLDDNQLKALGKALLSQITKIASGKVYKDPKKVLGAYNELQSLPGSWAGLIKRAEVICDKLAELELSDAKVAKKIQKELNDKLKSLYTVGKGSVSLNDVATVLGDIKLLPELDPLLNNTVK